MIPTLMDDQTRRTFAIGVFAVLGITFLGATHYYLAARLILDPGIAEPLRSLGLVAVALAAALLVLQPISERTLPRRYSRWVAWPASLWMGAGFWLLLLLFASDAFLWVAGGVARAADTSEPGSGAAAYRAAFVVGIAFTAVAAGLRSAMRPPRVRRESFHPGGCGLRPRADRELRQDARPRPGLTRTPAVGPGGRAVAGLEFRVSPAHEKESKRAEHCETTHQWQDRAVIAETNTGAEQERNEPRQCTDDGGADPGDVAERFHRHRGKVAKQHAQAKEHGQAIDHERP